MSRHSPSTGLGFRLALGASLLVGLTAVAVAWGLFAVVEADLHRDLELRSGAVAAGLARAAAPLLLADDRAGLERLLSEVWDVEDLGRVEVRDGGGRVAAVREFPAPALGEQAVVVTPITTEPDEDGFRDSVGSIHVVLSGAGNQARRLRYLERAVRVTVVVVGLGLVLAAALAWAVSRPLRRLERAASALAVGEYTGTLPGGGPREVHRLGQVVSEAIAAVAAREADLKEANERLGVANERLGVANEKLRRTEEAREAMTHMLVHDLKGPLSNLLMMLDVIEGDVHPDDRPLLEEGRLRCHGLLEMVQDLLAMGRIEAGHVDLALEGVGLRALVDEAMSQVDHLARQRRFSMKIEVLGDPGAQLVCDRRLIQRVLVNLLVNALKHGRSPVRLVAEGRAGEGVLVVEDAGAGVPPELEERVFEKFHKGVGSRGGSGLGLAFVRLVVQAHGGSVHVKGARFEVRLPARVESA